MKKRKFAAGHAGLDGTNTSVPQTATMKNQGSNFGVVAGIKPAARDGHSQNISNEGLLFVFGGDRHHMPFNDLYLMKV